MTGRVGDRSGFRGRAIARVGLVHLVLLVLSPTTFSAFSYAAIGEVIENAKLPSLEGGKRAFLSSDGEVSVFLFFKPTQEHSRRTLSQMEGLRQEMADRPVHWAAIVSDSFSTAEVEAAIRELEIEIPVLIDREDKLYGTLGVALHPVLGITDGQHVLRAYEPFRKINYGKVTEARILHALGEITDEQLELALSPPPAVQGGDAVVAKRNLGMARMLFKKGGLEKALELARKAVELDPMSADAHALVGSVLVEMEDCPAAVSAFDRALEIDAEHADARAGKEVCASGP